MLELRLLRDWNVYFIALNFLKNSNKSAKMPSFSCCCSEIPYFTKKCAGKSLCNINFWKRTYVFCEFQVTFTSHRNVYILMPMEERVCIKCGSSMAIKMKIFGLYRINSYRNSPHESYVSSIPLSICRSFHNLNIRVMF